MKWLVASDIHGAEHAAETIKIAFLETKADKILLLGDLLYHGPRNPLPKDYAPRKVADILNSLAPHIASVKGNCDSEVDQMMLSFDILTPKLYLSLDSSLCLCCHGHHMEEEAKFLGPNELLLHGHTHVPCCEKTEKYIRLNPGSVALPKEDHPKTLAILEPHQFTIFRAEDLSVYMHLSF